MVCFFNARKNYSPGAVRHVVFDVIAHSSSHTNNFSTIYYHAGSVQWGIYKDVKTSMLYTVSVSKPAWLYCTKGANVKLAT
jgi:hypothetical protein